jgi:hypothetical protein
MSRQLKVTGTKGGARLAKAKDERWVFGSEVCSPFPEKLKAGVPDFSKDAGMKGELRTIKEKMKKDYNVHVTETRRCSHGITLVSAMMGEDVTDLNNVSAIHGTLYVNDGDPDVHGPQYSKDGYIDRDEVKDYMGLLTLNVDETKEYVDALIDDVNGIYTTRAAKLLEKTVDPLVKDAWEKEGVDSDDAIAPDDPESFKTAATLFRAGCKKRGVPPSQVFKYMLTGNDEEVGDGKPRAKKRRSSVARKPTKKDSSSDSE